MTDQEILDVLHEAIVDSMDYDWTTLDGARACLAALKELGLIGGDA